MKKISKLSSKTKYLQIALNSTPRDAERIIRSLPPSSRILLEAGTPLIKEYGAPIISKIRSRWNIKLMGIPDVVPYVVADLKTMDRGEREVFIAALNGASAAVALGMAPVETLNSFIDSCKKMEIDSMVDMMNVDKPYQILRRLKTLPDVVMLHRGVDEERFSDKPLPIHLINKIRGSFNTMISVAGGDTSREMQSSFFNGASIVVLWKNFFKAGQNTAKIAEDFLRQVK